MNNLSALCYNYDIMKNQLITQQGFASVQEAQAGISRLFNKAKTAGRFFTVLRNQQPLGVLIPQEMWEEIIEDFEALSSQKYLSQIKKSRKDTSRVSAKKVKKDLGLSK